MKNIIIIGPAHPLRGGIAAPTERLARQFHSEGDKVMIFTFSLQYPSFLFPGTSQFSESPPPAELNINVCINSINPFNWYKIGRQLAKMEPDAIIVRYWLPFMAPCLGTILRIVRKNKYTKIIALVDNMIPHEKRIGDSQLTNYFVGAIDEFVAMSKSVVRDIQTFTTKPVHYYPLPLSDNYGKKMDKKMAREKLGLKESDFVFLFFGLIRHYKGLDLLIDALEHVKAAKSSFKLVVAGEFYNDKHEIEDKIASSSRSEDIISHTYFISNEEIGTFFSACDVVVQPYRNATQSGVTPIAYDFELPMIVTNVGGLPEMVTKDFAEICEPNAESIALALERMLNRDLEKCRGPLIIEKKRYSWAGKTSFFRSLISNGKL